MLHAARRKRPLRGKEQGGFTIVELVITVGIVAVIATALLIGLSGRKSRLELETATRQVAGLLREAQSRSMSQASSTSWGVRFENSTSTRPFYALFSVPYSSSTVVKRYTLPVSIRYATSSVPTGGNLEITFAEITGVPSAPATLVLELVGGGGAPTGPTITRGASGKIFFDDFNRPAL